MSHAQEHLDPAPPYEQKTSAVRPLTQLRQQLEHAVHRHGEPDADAAAAVVVEEGHVDADHLAVDIAM